MSDLSAGINKMPLFIQQAWKKAGFSEETEIQKRVIPLIQEGHDLIAESPTGTGKTLAYLLPFISKIRVEIKQAQLVVLAPTRELVMQIIDVVGAFTTGSEIGYTALIGGADIKRQQEKLKKHPQIIVGTPARIYDFIKAKKLKMHEVKGIVVDEVDQMLSMKLMPTIQEIVKSTLKERQMIFTSATISTAVEQLAEEMLKQPKLVKVKRDEKKDLSVSHQYLLCSHREKADMVRSLVHLLSGKGLVFIQHHYDVETVAAKLSYRGIEAGLLHGQSKQTERETMLGRFRSGAYSVLVVTDLAARGLDLEGVDYVIHYQLAENREQYIHRSGRTGRMGRSGQVISLVRPEEEKSMIKLAAALSLPIEKKILKRGKLQSPHSTEMESRKKGKR